MSSKLQELLITPNVFVYARNPKAVNSKLMASLQKEIDNAAFSLIIQKNKRKDDTILVSRQLNHEVAIRRILYELFVDSIVPFVPRLYAAFDVFSDHLEIGYLVTDFTSPKVNSLLTQMQNKSQELQSSHVVMTFLCHVLIALDRLQFLGFHHNHLDIEALRVRHLKKESDVFGSIKYSDYSTLCFQLSDGTTIDLPNVAGQIFLENFAHAEMTLQSPAGKDLPIVHLIPPIPETEPCSIIKEKYAGKDIIHSFDVDTIVHQFAVAFKNICPELAQVVEYLVSNGASWSVDYNYPISLSQRTAVQVLDFIRTHTRALEFQAEKLEKGTQAAHQKLPVRKKVDAPSLAEHFQTCAKVIDNSKTDRLEFSHHSSSSLTTTDLDSRGSIEKRIRARDSDFYRFASPSWKNLA